MIVLREGKWLCRVFSTQRFSWRNVRIFRRENWLWLTISCVIFILIMETLWIHCHVRKLFRKNTLCNQYTINKRRPVVQRPSRLKSKNSRTPAGWPSQRGTHLSNFDDSSILVKRIAVTVSEIFEKCEDFWKVTFRAPICLLLSVVCCLLLSRRKPGKPASPANKKSNAYKEALNHGKTSVSIYRCCS